jgi:hypothetical protein
MRRINVLFGMVFVIALGAGCQTNPSKSQANAKLAAAPLTLAPAAIDLSKARVEADTKYAKAHPEIREYVHWTAQTFGPSGMWLNEEAFATWPADQRESRILYLKTLLEDGEYGRHLCSGLAEASALKDSRLVAGLMKVAGYHRSAADYDCRAKWMAVAALARQESEAAGPLLVSLVDHGNQNTRNWARAALARQTGQDFAQDKQAWARWWRDQGHPPIAEDLMKPWAAPPKPQP